MRTSTNQRRLASILVTVVVAAFFALTRTAPSQPAAAPVETSPTAQPEQNATEPSQTSQDAVIHASNQRALQAQLGKEVAVEGQVARSARSSSGIHFLNLENSQLSIVCFKEDAKKFEKESPSDQFRDKDIQIRGKLEQYKGKLQIKLVDPKQIRIVEKADPTATNAAPQGIELKRIGNDIWLSPAGLRYAGRDPAGLTRVEHIERHTSDEPDRDGSHGVFDGGAAVAFAVIDEAWRRAEKSKLRAEVEGDRSSYTVPMGRRVGFLGGRSGKQRRHPPLQRVFIVFETDSKNIITAFPR